MPRTPYLHDVFVSYSSLDRRWVQRFVEDLKERVSQLMGREVPIWWDQQNIAPGDYWDVKMLEDARRSRLFVPVVSPGWLNSKPCQRELAAFREHSKPGSLIPAVLCPIDSPAINAVEHVRFYREEQDLIVELARQPRTKALNKLSQVIAHRLKRPEPTVAAGSRIEKTIAATRDRIAPQTLELCGWMRILNMTQRIDLSHIYTEVNIFESVRAHERRSINQNQDDWREEDFEAPSARRRAAKEALSRHPRLLILGRPGAGKTTFLRRLAVEAIRGDYRSDLVPAYIEFRSLQGASILRGLRQLWKTAPEPILREGRALLLLDGLDEVTAKHFTAIRDELEQILTSDTRSQVIRDLANCCSRICLGTPHRDRNC